jgi:hypothetical protein
MLRQDEKWNMIAPAYADQAAKQAHVICDRAVVMCSNNHNSTRSIR